MVPTRAMAKAPKAPIPLRLDAPLEPVALATACPWKVVPVTTWPLMVVVTVETPDVGEAVAMVLLQSVQVPVKLVHGASLPHPPAPPGGPPWPPKGPPVSPGPHDPVMLHVDHEQGPQPLIPGPLYPAPGPPHGAPLAQPLGAPGRAEETAENHGPPPHVDHPEGHAEPPDVAEKVASGAAVTVCPALAQT